VINVDTLKLLRQRKVVISALVGLFVILIWLVAVFNPEGHKLANVNSQVEQAQSAQSALQLRLAKLRHYSKESAQFIALGQRLSAAVPATTDVYDYITAISNAAQASGVKVSSLDPSGPQAAGNVTVIPVTVSASGNYGQTLAFIKALDALPRLTVITQISITGGGAGTNRSAVLTDQFGLYIFAQSSAAAKAATPSTTTSAG